MIIRTYQRRNRSGRSLSDSGTLHVDTVGSSGSQESLRGSSQEAPPFSFPSSQESCWSQSDYGNSSRSFKSTWSESQEDDFSEDVGPGTLSRLSRSRSLLDKPPLDSSKRRVDGSLSRGKSKFPNGMDRDLERKRLPDTYGIENWENGAGTAKSKRQIMWKDDANDGSGWGATGPATSTLMETQESGEMMEHVDEANFALDGLRQGQPVRIQRASLTSLLSLCGSVQRRRMLRTNGMAKPVLDAIVALPTDDPALALAAAAVLYFLAVDSQEEDLLDSEACVLFLMRLLGARSSKPVVKKGLSAIGSKLVALSKSSGHESGTTLLGVDRGAAVVTKVRELFQTLREHGTGTGSFNDENGILLGDEISSKCLALLTLEKACISTVVLEDNTAEAVGKVGGRFKERLRELGGLDAVCELAASCLVNLKEALKTSDEDECVELDLSSLEKNEKSGGIGVLLRCLRVMENVTFLSEQNQKHLLVLKLARNKVTGIDSFIGLTVSAIDTLSELARKQNEDKDLSKKRSAAHVNDEASLSKRQAKSQVKASPSVPTGKRLRSLADCFRPTERFGLGERCAAEKAETSICAKKAVSSPLTFKRRKLSIQQKLEVLNGSRSSDTSINANETESESATGKGTRILNPKRNNTSRNADRRFEDHQSSRLSDDGPSWKAAKGGRCRRDISREDFQDPFALDSTERVLKGGATQMSSDVEDSQDPFAFDELEIDLKSYERPKGRPKRDQAKSKSVASTKGASRLQKEENREMEPDKLRASDGSEYTPKHGSEGREEGNRATALLGDCLLSGVKVLMNLTNGNPSGCHQVAACGGFNSLSSLLIANYPWPKSPAVSADTLSARSQSQGREHMKLGCPRQAEGDSEQDLDLLVTVLGVLCNLVEKDINNRAKLANLKVAVPSNIKSTTEGKLWLEDGMIGLLCSLFLLKQGAGEAAEAIENKRALEVDEEVRQGQAEAENMIVEAYTALLLGFLSKESEQGRIRIARLLPGNNLKALVPVLERFVAFHLSLNMISEETHAVIDEVLDSCKQPV